MAPIIGDPIIAASIVFCDDEMSTTSENPVQNKVVTASVDDVKDNLFKVAELEPSDETNKLWLQTGEQTVELAEMSDLNSVATEIRSMVGAPMVATTAADMTDTSKIYVYVGSDTGYTSGSWYYYNGSAWTLGGVYNSQGVQIDQQMSSTSTNVVGNKVIKEYVDTVAVYGYDIVELTGTEITLAAQPNTMYICGELASLEITSLPSTGVVDILFTSGTTPTVLDYSQTALKMPGWFSVGASMTVELNILNGVYGSVQTWE